MMNGSQMGDEVVAAIKALYPDITTDQENHLKSAWEAICGAIVAHIQAHAVVTSTVAVASVTAVTPGGGISGPGTGTASGTVA